MRLHYNKWCLDRSMATVLHFAWREKLQVLYMKDLQELYDDLKVLCEIKSTCFGPIRLQYLLQLRDRSYY